MGGFGRQFLVQGFFGVWIVVSIWSSWLFGMHPPGAISNALCIVSSNSRKIGVNLKKLDRALFIFFNPLLCVWIFNNNVASRVCYNNMKLVWNFLFPCISMKTLVLKYHATPTPLEKSISLRCDFFPFLGWTWRLRELLNKIHVKEFF